ncbi:hypothetical protein [Amnibacterium endophyticum]|uniref:IrrE N-terminal-like domain-containing protein n=1 Tax=Amnibacterium endophyticum TaxID=2109337 RepID=A0ABW4LGM4_9MICO
MPTRFRSRRQVNAMLRRVGFPSGSFEAMQDFMQTWLGREIRIEHHDFRGSSVCGLWLGSKHERVDRIFTDLESPHWRQTVAHEWGHMLCGHDIGADDVEVLRSLAPLLPESAIRFALSRESFTTPQEQDAEAVGDAISLLLLAEESRAASAQSLGGFGRVL